MRILRILKQHTILFIYPKTKTNHVIATQCKLIMPSVNIHIKHEKSFSACTKPVVLGKKVC